ncbi:MAG TPA: amidohydrolase [Methanosarcinales archaeon]|nr:amidohydrolase [Methanosarcinales archaeon]
MIIDSHVHIGKDKDGSSQNLSQILEVMDESKINKAIIIPFNEINPGPTFKNANDLVIKAQKEHPDRIIGFARLDPYYGKEAYLELERMINQGIKGLKLHPRSQAFLPDPNHPIIYSILDLLNIYNLPLLLHTDLVARNTNMAIVDKIATKFPELKIIAAHAGKNDSNTVSVLQKHENVYIESSFASLIVLKKILIKLGAERIIFGSDLPYSHPKIELAKLEILELSPSDKKKILSDNILNLGLRFK